MGFSDILKKKKKEGDPGKEKANGEKANGDKSESSDQQPQPDDATSGGPQQPSEALKAKETEKREFHISVEDALTPDPGTEDMYLTDDNKLGCSPGQLSKLLNPKDLNVYYALGGLTGILKALRTDRKAGLSTDETTLDGYVRFEDVAPKGVSPYGLSSEEAIRATKLAAEAAADPKKGGGKGKAKGKEQIDLPNVDMSDGRYVDRKRVFRDNRLPKKKTKTILELAWDTYNDKILILLSFAALVSLALGLYQTFGISHDDGTPKVEWVEGVAIMVAIFIVVAVGTTNDWQMERSFNKLNTKADDKTVKVIRSGKSIEISIYDILVGDVMHLSTGDLVPVDGIFIDGHGVKCDESSATGESDLLKKTPGDKVFQALQEMRDGTAQHPDIEKLDPFIISGSKVNEGTGTFVVTAVGVHSSYGRIMMTMQSDSEQTPLQQKLNILADAIAKAGGGAALLLFLVLLIKWGAQLGSNTSSPSEKGQQFLRLFITAVTVVVVAVPEGLPLAVTLALSFATNRMTKDNNLVRVLKACETMGNATTVCSDKTGTLTQNKMTVVAATLGNAISFGGTDAPLEESEEKKANSPAMSTESGIRNFPVQEFVDALSKTTKELIIQANAVNSTAFEGDVDGEQSFVGSKTEVALLTFSRDRLASAAVHEVRSNSQIVQQVPFDSALKFMATVVKLKDNQYRAYVKGASEILLGKCTQVLSDPSAEQLTTAELTADLRETLSSTITSYAGQTLRTISSSYRDFESWPPADAVSKEDPKSADFAKLHEDMTLIGIFGIKDPLRLSVPGAIKDCQHAGVVVRMVTGDNILTGSAIAKECGIYHPDEGDIAMEGPDFRRKSSEELKEIVPSLRVLARSSPEDKRILVRTLKDLGETVAVTGDGTNDAPALKMADIGFAMGIAGTEVAKEAASIILMDDNFSSIVKGMMWGRAVNDSVKKFLQFQLTVNVTAVVLTFVSAVASSEEESVLNAVQLLWVNLIMDTFAALALATDPPTRAVLDRPPDRKSVSIITLRMAKMIVGQAICQLAITLVLNFAGGTLLGYHDMVNGEKRLKTLVFNTFVWLQIFNEINNRRLDNKLNVFEAIHKNWIFAVINLVMIGGQVLIIFVGGEAFKITPLDGKEWGLSIGLGAISLPWGAIVRKFPDSWVMAMLPYYIRIRWLPETVSDEEKAKHPVKPKKAKKGKKKAKKDVEAGEGGQPPSAEDGAITAPEGTTDVEDDESIRPLGAKPPLRTLTTIRGKRALNRQRTQHRDFRTYMHDQKARVKDTMSSSH